jgi:hypothetical protein
MLDEERIRYASEPIRISSYGLPITVLANANGWHVSVALPGAGRRYKTRFLTIGSSEIDGMDETLTEAFQLLENLKNDRISSGTLCKIPIMRDISVLHYPSGQSGIAFCDELAIISRDQLSNFIEALKRAPEIGERLYAQRTAEFEKVLQRRATNPLPTDPEVIQREVASLLKQGKHSRKVYDWEISSWQGDPSNNAHPNSPEKRRSKAQSGKRTAVRNREADAALLPWKILVVVLMILVGWISYEVSR